MHHNSRFGRASIRVVVCGAKNRTGGLLNQTDRLADDATVTQTIGAVFAFLSLVSLLIAVGESRRYWRVADTPTIPAGNAFPGEIEIAGAAGLRHGRQIISPLSAANCAWVQWKLHRADDAGEISKTTVLTSDFQVYVRDGTGAVTVHLDKYAPLGAVREEFEYSTGDHRRLSAARTGGRAPVVIDAAERNLFAAYMAGQGTRTQEYTRIEEIRLEVGAPLLVNGTARVSDDGGPLVMSSRFGPLTAWVGDQPSLIGRLRFFARLCFGLFVLFTGLAYGYLQVRRPLGASSILGVGLADGSGAPRLAPSATGPEETMGLSEALGLLPLRQAVLGWWLATLVVLFVQSFRVRNRIVGARERVFAAWALIDIACEKRRSLISALLASVTAAAHVERTNLHRITELRSLAEAAQGKAPTNDRLLAVANSGPVGEAAARTLLSLREASPDLYVDSNFSGLIRQLVIVEEGVAAARSYYEDARTVLQDRTQTFPDSFVALFAGPMPPFGPSVSAAEKSQAAVQRRLVLHELRDDAGGGSVSAPEPGLGLGSAGGSAGGSGPVPALQAGEIDHDGEHDPETNPFAFLVPAPPSPAPLPYSRPNNEHSPDVE